MNLKKIAISGLKWSLLDKMGKALFQLLQVAILTRFLSKEDFGLVAMALVVINLSNLFVDMGFSVAILHHKRATKKEYSSIYWFNIFISLVLYAILYFTTPLVAEFYSTPDLLAIIPILGVNVLLLAMGRQHRTIMQKEFRFKPIALIELSSFFIGLIVAVGLAYKGFGVYSLIYSTLIQSALSNLFFLIRNFQLNPILLHFSLKETRPFLKVGGFQMGSSLLDFVSKEADILIIGKLFGAQTLGLYSLTKQIVLKLFIFINPIVTSVLSPLLSSIQEEHSRLRELYLKVVRYIAYINFPVYLMVIVLSKEILFYVYGSAYTNGAWVLSFLAVYYCLIAISSPVGSLQIATGRTDLGLLWTGFRVVITPIAIYWGASYGINGVGIAFMVLGFFMVAPLWFIQIKPMIKIPFKQYLKQFYKPLILFFFIGIMALLGKEILNITASIMGVLIIATFTVTLFLGLLYSIDRSSFLNFKELIFSECKNMRKHR